MLAPPDDKDAIIGQLREEIALTKADLSDLQDGYDRGHAELVKQAETIRQMTELLREYKAYHREWAHTFGDDRCSLCLKADLLLKEPA